MCSSYFSTAEVARLFAPYNRGSNTTRGSNTRSIGRTLPASNIQRTSFTHTFCVLSDHNATKIPSIQEDLRAGGKENVLHRSVYHLPLCTIYTVFKCKAQVCAGQRIRHCKCMRRSFFKLMLSLVVHVLKYRK